MWPVWQACWMRMAVRRMAAMRSGEAFACSSRLSLSMALVYALPQSTSWAEATAPITTAGLYSVRWTGPTGPCSLPEDRQFDFWLGEWEVRSAAGQVLGHNRISKRYGGCVVLEEWESASGGSGSSFNLYDSTTKQWHQFWVDASGTNWLSSDGQGNPTTLRGGMRDGAMVLVSQPETLPSIGLTRATWRPLPDGGVRQTFEGSSDGGKTWTVSFDGFYKRTKP